MAPAGRTLMTPVPMSVPRPAVILPLKRLGLSEQNPAVSEASGDAGGVTW